MFEIDLQFFFKTYFYLTQWIYFDSNVKKMKSHKYSLGPH
jgi:hypothetical protein